MFQIALAILPLLAATPAQEVVEDLETQEEIVFFDEEDPSEIAAYEDQEYLEEIVFDNDDGFSEAIASFEEN